MSANDIVVVSLKYSGIIRFLNLNQYKLLAIHVYTLYIILNEIKSIFDTVEVQCLCAYYIARLISMHVTVALGFVKFKIFTETLSFYFLKIDSVIKSTKF